MKISSRVWWAIWCKEERPPRHSLPGTSELRTRCPKGTGQDGKTPGPPREGEGGLGAGDMGKELGVTGLVPGN